MVIVRPSVSAVVGVAQTMPRALAYERPIVRQTNGLTG